VRLLLDAHFSPKRVAGRLRAAGHDVRALAEHSELDGLKDEELLELATAEGRILVTRDTRHFAPLARAWASVGKHHAGLLLVWTRQADEFGPLLRDIQRLPAERPDQASWIDVSLAI
jgi:hypothetical protein